MIEHHMLRNLSPDSYNINEIIKFAIFLYQLEFFEQVVILCSIKGRSRNKDK
jgi:hypothetical protein